MALNCNKSKENIEKEKPKTIKESTVKNKKVKVEEIKKQAEFIVVIKDVTNLEDAKSLIVNSGLTWDKLAIDTEVLKAAYIKVPIEKKEFWLKRLQQSNVFSSIDNNSKDALKSIKYIAENTFVKLRKTHCSGVFPVYDAIFLKNGNVIFNGIENVLVTGSKEFTMTKQQQEKIVKMFDKTSFKEYKNTFITRSVADFPSTFITHQNKQIEIKLWKNVPDELAFAYEALEDILLEKKLID